MKNRIAQTLLAFCLCIAPAWSAEFYTAQVVGVADGDTLTVLRDGRQIKIRIAGIDAPEKKQAWGQRSKQSLSDLVFGKPVQIEARKTDRYGRTLARVLVNQSDVGLTQISSGLAWFYVKYAHEQPAEEVRRYAEAERLATEARKGLWSERDPVPPWDWRHSRRDR